MVEFANGIKEYTITNGEMRLSVLNVGGVITELSRNNQNIVIKFEDYASYLDNSMFLGAVVGRSAGRIRNGKIGDYQIPINFNGKHNLHGNDLHLKFYQVEVSDNQIICTLNDPAGPFPGNAKIQIKYKLLTDRLVQTFTATSDEPTVFNMTNHAYFNLNMKKSILDHKLHLEADVVGELDSDLLPVADIPVENTAFDFNTPRKISDSFAQGHSQFAFSKYIDHPFKKTGIIKLTYDTTSLEIVTDQDYVVAYLGNYVGDEINKFANTTNADYQAICLETQNRPNTIDLVTEYKATTEYIINN